MLQSKGLAREPVYRCEIMMNPLQSGMQGIQVGQSRVTAMQSSLSYGYQ
jgi:hypothetical protein